MREFTIELDETICKWLEHISEVTGETVEHVISNSIFNQVTALENNVSKTFTYKED